MLRELMSNILAPPVRTTLPLSDLFSIFSPSNPGPIRGGIFEFEANFPIGIPLTPEPSLNLSMSEVESSTELVEYHESDPSMIETRCPITFDDFSEGEEVRRIRHCKHYFKSTAIIDWLRNTRGSCPVCRYDILEEINRVD